MYYPFHLFEFRQFCSIEFQYHASVHGVQGLMASMARFVLGKDRFLVTY